MVFALPAKDALPAHALLAFQVEDSIMVPAKLALTRTALPALQMLANAPLVNPDSMSMVPLASNVLRTVLLALLRTSALPAALLVSSP